MKKRFFDIGLYADALRQLRLIGVAAFIILELEAILLPLASWFSQQQMIATAISPRMLLILRTCSNGIRWLSCALF